MGFILPLTMLLIVAIMLRLLRRTDKHQWLGYTTATFIAALAGVLLIRAEPGFPWSTVFLGYLIATGLGVTQPFAPLTYEKRRSSSPEAEQAWKRFDQVMLQNKRLNLALGLLLIISALWFTFVSAP